MAYNNTQLETHVVSRMTSLLGLGQHLRIEGWSLHIFCTKSLLHRPFSFGLWLGYYYHNYSIRILSILWIYSWLIKMSIALLNSKITKTNRITH